jgi:chemotaxis protein MotA
MTKEADAENSYLHVIRVIILSFLKGLAPILAVEMGRRAIPAHVRPTFVETETACRRPAGGDAAPAEPGSETTADAA